MYNIAAMGDKDSICGFAALGIEIYPVEEAGAAVETLRKIASAEYAVVYITEALAAKIQDEIDRYRENITPAIILIPGIAGNTGMGLSRVIKTVEKAVGSDVLN